MSIFRNQKQDGFTLIELLVVISIISLLSSVVLAALNSARSKAIDSKKISMVVEYKKALALYYNQYGTYPDTSYVDTCLGQGNPGGDCFAGQSPENYGGINAELAPYIPGPPANTDSVIIGGLDYRGLGYICVGSPNCGDDYALYWVMRGSNTSCAGGFADNTSNPIVSPGSIPNTNTVCVYTTNQTNYNLFFP